MYKKFLPFFIMLGFALQAANMPAVGNSGAHHHHRDPAADPGGVYNFALFTNQAAVTTGENIPWSDSNVNNSQDIIVDVAGNVTLPRTGVFLVQYTVRINKTPFNGTSSAVVQLQQTVDDVATNITQSAITTNLAVDELTASVPESQTQITGFALIDTHGRHNNVINLNVTLGTNLTIPAATGTDANAELLILQLQ